MEPRPRLVGLYATNGELGKTDLDGQMKTHPEENSSPGTMTILQRSGRTAMPICVRDAVRNQMT